MKKIYDSLSLKISKVIDILFIFNPLGTARGFLFAGILDGINLLFGQGLENTLHIRFTALSFWHYLLFSLFVFNIGANVKEKKLPESIELALDMIKKLETEQGINREESETLYIELIKKVIDNSGIDDDLKEKSKEINDIINGTQK